MSSQDPNRGSIRSYVIGANPRSPDDGNGGRTWTPWNSPCERPVEQRVERRKVAAQGVGIGQRAAAGSPRRVACVVGPAGQASRAVAQGLGELARPSVAVAAHLVAQVGEARRDGRRRRTRAGRRRRRARSCRAEHGLCRRRDDLEAGPPAGAVVRLAGELRARPTARGARRRSTRGVRSGRRRRPRSRRPRTGVASDSAVLMPPAPGISAAWMPGSLNVTYPFVGREGEGPAQGRAPDDDRRILAREPGALARQRPSPRRAAAAPSSAT